MFEELDEMSKGEKLYDYECVSCGFKKGLPEFLIEEFRQNAIFGSQSIASLDEMPILECPLCGAKFEYKKLTTVRRQLR